jgi:hypothetical protein
MLSNRLAVLAVVAGASLLGVSSAGVTAIAGDVPTTATPLVAPHERDHDDDHGHGPHGHHGERGL